MGDYFAFNASGMQNSAGHTRNALAGLGVADMDRVGDCGSSLVATTVDFFLDLLKEALDDADQSSEKLAKNIELTAEDFVGTESTHQSELDSFVDTLKGIY